MSDRATNELLHTLIFEMREHRLAMEGTAYRNRLLLQLAAALGLGNTWACAQTVSLILGGARDTPEGCEWIVELLRSRPLSARQIMRILREQSEKVATDISGQLCQWLKPMHDDLIEK